MMHDREKSDPAIVAGKPTNKAGQLAAEPVEPRGTRAGKARTGHRDGSACHKR
jgi:RNA-directed DNA polymerase